MDEQECTIITVSRLKAMLDREAELFAINADLLEACQRLVRHEMSLRGKGWHCDVCEQDSEAGHHHHCPVLAAEHAIKKATE
jgi:hypothetical protein